MVCSSFTYCLSRLSVNIMEHKLTLRKLHAIIQELQKAIRDARQNLTETKTVTLRAFQVEAYQDTVVKASLLRSENIAKAFQLQKVLSHCRSVVAEQNKMLGINDVLQTLRETEDLLAICLDANISDKTQVSFSNDATTLEDVVAHLEAYKTSTVERGRSRGEGVVTLVHSCENEIQLLRRKIKNMKDDQLVALNFKNVKIQLTENEKALLMSLNIL